METPHEPIDPLHQVAASGADGSRTHRHDNEASSLASVTRQKKSRRADQRDLSNLPRTIGRRRRCGREVPAYQTLCAFNQLPGFSNPCVSSQSRARRSLV
jgi:hypothetical protein